jgi:hypothetical protein
MTNPGPDRTRDVASTPVWLKALGIIVLLAVVLFVVVMLIAGGHTPRPHGL